jgi:hypothetical protein
MTSRAHSGIDVLKIICILFCLLSLLSIVPGIHSIHSQHFEFLSGSHGPLRLFISLLNAVLFAMGFYGIQRRLLIAWKLGWYVFTIFLLEWFGSSLSSSLTSPQPGSRIASLSIVIGGLCVAAYWGLWWKRQKSYFSTAPSKKA